MSGKGFRGFVWFVFCVAARTAAPARRHWSLLVQRKLSVNLGNFDENIRAVSALVPKDLLPGTMTGCTRCCCRRRRARQQSIYIGKTSLSQSFILPRPCQRNKGQSDRDAA